VPPVALARGRFTRKYLSTIEASRLRKGMPQLRQASRRSADFGSASTQTTSYPAPGEAANTIKRPIVPGYYVTALDRRKAARSANLCARSLMGLWSTAPTADVGQCARRSLHRTHTCRPFSPASISGAKSFQKGLDLKFKRDQLFRKGASTGASTEQETIRRAVPGVRGGSRRRPASAGLR
jgi:hypothetical protein